MVAQYTDLRKVVIDLIVLGEAVIPLGTAASTDSPNVSDGATVIRAYRSGSTIYVEAYDPVNDAWRSVALT